MPTLAYCATLNNWTQQEWDVLVTPNAKLQYIIIGQEVGEQGTPHLQIYFQLAKQTMLTSIKRWGGPWARMHMEGARGTDEEASTYCKKERNFVEIGERKSMGRKGARSDLNAVKEAIERGDTYDTICEEHFEVASRCNRFIKERVQARESGKQVSELLKQYENFVPRPWQQALLDVVKEEACPRKIHWYWEMQGNVGKSYMTSYLGSVLGATVLTGGKKVDMAYIYAQKPTDIVVFDLGRTTEQKDGERFLDGMYSLAEDLKNGRVVSTKYESKTVFFKIPHVIIFANFSPDMTKWSQDRYFVKRL